MRITGAPVFGLTVRPWSTAALDAAAHRPDLVPDGRLHLTLDLAQHGIGSAACGPATLARYELRARPATFRLRFEPS
ncbi:hypothetical protein ACFSTC_30925 [Nonomuraea ferruginea]